MLVSSVEMSLNSPFLQKVKYFIMTRYVIIWKSEWEKVKSTDELSLAYEILDKIDSLVMKLKVAVMLRRSLQLLKLKVVVSLTQ